jgi:NAD(P)-dependent dehydrogenase (short-subunit alcohol dehydrogenase family)
MAETSAVPLLANRVALITGGAAGLGRSIAHTFAQFGATGTVLDIDGLAVRAAAPDGWLPVETDVTDESGLLAAYEATVSRFGRLDIVVANAGLVPRWASVTQLQFDEWDRVFAVNVRGVAATIKQAVPHLSAKGGSIIAMASTSSWRARAGQCLYTATKHAVLGIVRAAAQDLGPMGIRVNALGPGPVATDAMRARIEKRRELTGLDVEAALKRYGSQTALGRIASHTDVAHMAVFLASDLASGITGTVAPIDCGWP